MAVVCQRRRGFDAGIRESGASVRVWAAVFVDICNKSIAVSPLTAVAWQQSNHCIVGLEALRCSLDFNDEGLGPL